MASPAAAIRTLTGHDDPAIFIDDTFDAETVRSISGASPSAMVMLSPQRMPVDADGMSPAGAEKGTSPKVPPSYTLGMSDSARRGVRPSPSTFGRDLTNVPRAPLGKQLNFSTPSAHKTFHTSSRSIPSHSTATHQSTSISPAQRGDSLADLLDRYVPNEEHDQVVRERNRFKEMYRYQAQLCDEFAKREEDARAALQEKIIELIAVSSRNEESKRFIRQIKKEMQQCRERTLPFLNKQLEDTRFETQLRESLDERMREEEDRHLDEVRELRKEMAAMKALLNDSKCASALGKSSESLLRAAYLKNTQMYDDLCQARHNHRSELDRRHALEKEVDVLRREGRDSGQALAKERRRNYAREEQLIIDAHSLHDEIMNLTSELLELRIQLKDPSELDRDSQSRLHLDDDDDESRYHDDEDDSCETILEAVEIKDLEENYFPRVTPARFTSSLDKDDGDVDHGEDTFNSTHKPTKLPQKPTTRPPALPLI